MFFIVCVWLFVILSCFVFVVFLCCVSYCFVSFFFHVAFFVNSFDQLQLIVYCCHARSNIMNLFCTDLPSVPICVGVLVRCFFFALMMLCRGMIFLSRLGKCLYPFILILITP